MHLHLCLYMPIPSSVLYHLNSRHKAKLFNSLATCSQNTILQVLNMGIHSPAVDTIDIFLFISQFTGLELTTIGMIKLWIGNRSLKD